MSERVYRTAIYARLSKDDGDKAESNSIVSQKAMCQEYIEKHKELELVEIFADDGYSGVDFNRPDFQRMEDAIREHRIDAIVCKDLSRFSRNYHEGGRYLEKIFPEMGVRFIAINDGYDTINGNKSSDYMNLLFKNLVNDNYSRDISVKVRTNLDVKRRRGDFVGPFTPYGYIKSPSDKNRLIVDEYSGNIVRQIFSFYKDGMSICKIADELNGLGILSPMEYKRSLGINYKTPFRTGETAKWSYKAVKRILTNEVYLGVLIQGRRGTANYKVHTIQEKDESEWIRFEDAHEPLVTYDDFMSVKEMLGRDTRLVGKGSEKNLFSGFIYCADCKQPMVRKKVKSGNKVFYYYVCSGNKRHEGCTPHSISAKKLTEAATAVLKGQVEYVLDISDALDYIEGLPDNDRAVINYEAQAEKLEEEIEHLKRMKFKIYEDYSGGEISKDDYTDFRNQIVDELDSKKTSLGRVQHEMKEAASVGNAGKTWVTLFKEYKGITELSRRVLMALVDKIFISEGHGIEIVLKYEDECQSVIDYVGKNMDLLQDVKEA